MLKIIAVLCSLANSGDCHEQTITTSDQQEGLTMTQCLVGMPSIAEWMKDKPQYRLSKWRCEIGDRAKRGI